MRIRVGVIALVAGCWGTSSRPDTTIANTQNGGLFTITATAFGPIDARRPATLQSLRRLFVGYDVKPLNDPNLEYHIYSGTEQLAFVVLNDDMTVFNIHATSGKVSVSDRPWRVGHPFTGSADLTQCECWGDNPTCFKRGEHVAVNFKRDCEGLTSGDRHALKVLDGLVVQRVIWSPTEFGGDAANHGFGGDSYGGDDSDGAP